MVIFGFLVLGILLLAVLAYLLGWRPGQRPAAPTAPPPEADPLHTAQRRYAEGEISREEFRKIEEDLRRP